MIDKTIPTIGILKEITFCTKITKERLNRYKYPTRFDAGVFIVIISGRGDISINLSDYSVDESCVITLTPSSIVQIINYSEDFNAYYIAFSPEFLKDINHIQSALSFLPEIKNNPVLEFNETSKSVILKFCEIFQSVYNKQSDATMPGVIDNLLMSMLWGIAAAYRSRNIIKDRKTAILTPRKSELYRKLLSLILENYKTDRTISFYAEKLCVSAKYLSVVTKGVSGKQIRGLINDAIILDAKSQLKNTYQTISQISNSLNFPNSSFFCKYFKKHTGMTPKEYRYSD